MAEPNNRYDLTAARQHAPPTFRRPWPKDHTIDCHSHAFVPAAATVAASHLRPDPRAAQYSQDTTVLARKQDADRAPNLVDVALRLRDFDGMGVGAQIVSPAPNQCYYDVPAAIGIEAARLVNQGMADIVAGSPRRILAALGSVPLQAGGDAAAAELEYAMTKLGLKGVEVLAHVGELELSDPSLEVFWAKAESLGAVIFIHPAGFTEARRFNRFYFNNVIGNPLDTAMALHYLIFDGVLERYPNLKLLAAHGGGFLPSYAGRIDHAWGARSDAHGSLPKPPSHYLKKIYFDTIVFTPEQLEYLVRQFGADHILMGTDYPYDMGEYDPLGHIDSVRSLSDSDRALIGGGNARTLFGL